MLPIRSPSMKDPMALLAQTATVAMSSVDDFQLIQSKRKIIATSNIKN